MKKDDENEKITVIKAVLPYFITTFAGRQTNFYIYSYYETNFITPRSRHGKPLRWAETA